MTQWAPTKDMYENAVTDLRELLREVGRHEFRAFGYTKQLRAYRAAVRLA